MSRYLTARRTGLSLLVSLTLAAVGCIAGQDNGPGGETEISDDAGLSAAQCASAAAWSSNKAYAASALVQYQGKAYSCLQAHTSQPGWTPAAVPALWHAEACSGGGTTSAASTSSSTTGSGTSTSSGSGGSGGSGGAGGAGGAGGGGQGGKLFVGYYQTWSDGWKANGADTVLAKLPSYVNVVNLSFAQPDMNYAAGSLSLGGTGIGVPYDGPTLKAAVAALHQKNPGTKVMLSVGGASFPSFAGWKPAVVAAFVKDFGLDGVDIDYEPASPACVSSGGQVSCPSDAEYVSVVKSMRAALPSPYWISIAGFSVGAYGEGNFASAQPPSSYAGISLAVLKQAGSALDLVNVMSYDASAAFDPVQALHAYQHYYAGRIAMGIEVPPEAWGGHIETVAEIDTLAAAVNGSGAAGLMLWSIQKPGPAQQFATEMCLKLGLAGCSTPML